MLLPTRRSRAAEIADFSSRWLLAFEQAGPALFTAALALMTAGPALADDTTGPALKSFTVAPRTDEIYSCPPGRQIYFVQATIERQTIPVVLLDAEGKAIQEEIFTTAHAFRLDRAHEHPVRVHADLRQVEAWPLRS